MIRERVLTALAIGSFLSTSSNDTASARVDVLTVAAEQTVSRFRAAQEQFGETVVSTDPETLTRWEATLGSLRSAAAKLDTAAAALFDAWDAELATLDHGAYRREVSTRLAYRRKRFDAIRNEIDALMNVYDPTTNGWRAGFERSEASVHLPLLRRTLASLEARVPLLAEALQRNWAHSCDAFTY